MTAEIARINEFVDIADHHPIRVAAAFLPDLVVELRIQPDVRLAHLALPAPDLNVGFLAQKLERAVRRAVVDDHDFVVQATMMREEVREDVFFVPASCVVMDRRVTTSTWRPAASCNSRHIPPTAQVSKFAHCNSLWSKF